MITSIFPTVCAREVEAVRDSYRDLLAFEVLDDSGGYVQLAAPVDGPQIGVVQREHDTAPQ